MIVSQESGVILALLDQVYALTDDGALVLSSQTHVLAEPLDWLHTTTLRRWRTGDD